MKNDSWSGFRCFMALVSFIWITTLSFMMALHPDEYTRLIMLALIVIPLAVSHYVLFEKVI